MIFSKLLASYHDIDFEGMSIEDVATKIGSQLGEVEWTKDTGKSFDGVYLAKIVSCEKHPDADKLNVCFIDDGGAADGVERNESGYVQVVCGAPNAKAGIAVAWIAPGSVVPSTVGTDDEFELSARELRGVVSNGMLASEKELGLSDNHDGIMEIDLENEVTEELGVPGTSFKKLFGLDDWLIDVENKMFTHRPDCFGNLGITRELSGILGKQFESPEWYVEPVSINFSDSSMKVELFNEVEDLVPRFALGWMDDIFIKQSPTYLKAYLSRIGSKAINIVVDTTNYMMMRTAQPTHAFDYDKVAALSGGEGAVLGPRLAKKGEKLKLLNGKEIELTEHDLVIATDKQPVALAGIMGGSETEVDDTTKRIIIEGATFDMYSIRRSSMRHGLFTDAGTRFTKGQSPHQNEQVIKRIMHDLAFECSAKSVGYAEASVKDIPKNVPVKLPVDFINSRLGTMLEVKDVEKMLKNVEFDVQANKSELTITAPFWRTDIAIPEDVVEEVGRLYGYDNLPFGLPKRSSRPTKLDGLISVKQFVRSHLSSLGATELLTYSFVKGGLLEAVQQSTKDSFVVTNALSPELEFYRQSVTPSLLSKVNQNIRAGFKEFALFEIAKTHSKKAIDEDGLPRELETLGLVYVNNNKDSETAYFSVKNYVDSLISAQGLTAEYKSFTEEPDFAVTKPFDINRSAQILVDDQLVGIVGEFKAEVEVAFKLPRQSAGFEMFTESLVNIHPVSNYVKLSDFPKSNQDITLQVSSDINFSDLDRSVRHILVDSGLWFEVETVSIYSKDQGSKNITFRISLADFNKTLTTEEVNGVIKNIAAYCRETCQSRQV